MAVVGLDHVQVAMPVGKEDLGRKFFCEILGFTEIEKPEPAKSRGGAWFASNGVVIHLGVEDEFRPAKKAHVALLVSNYDELRETFIEYALFTKDDDEQVGIIRFFGKDFFGNRIEIIDSESQSIAIANLANK